MGKCVLYVGGLSDNVSEHHLRDLLGTYGLVARAHVVRHKHSGKSAGYGFVEMGSGEQALEAVVHWKGCSTMAISYDSISLPIHQAVPKQLTRLTRSHHEPHQPRSTLYIS